MLRSLHVSLQEVGMGAWKDFKVNLYFYFRIVLS